MSQSWNAEGYARNARFVADLGAPVLDLLAPQPGERILDLGCGDGALTEKIIAARAIVTGADSSPELVEAARGRGIDCDLVDGHALGYDAEFNAVFSNAALHWMTRPDAVIAGVARALKPGGRFVGEFGGHGNVAAIQTALIAVLARRSVDGAARSPWFYPTPAEYSAKLEAHGFAIDSAQLVPRPTPLPTGMRGWLDTFANPFLSGFDAGEKAAILDETADLLAHSLRDQAGNWTADYIRLRFAARLKKR